MEQSNVLLVLMCLDLTDPNPLGSRSSGQEPRVRLLDESPTKPYQLLAAVLDPTHRATSAPVKGIALTDGKKRTYNSILRQFQKISATFYSENGYVNHPETYTDDRQADVEEAMSAVGRDIYDLFTDDGGPNPIRDWLDKLLGARQYGATRQRPIKPVTILSNDFGIPWFWLKREKTAPFLCEVCSLGLLQLSAVRAAEIHQAPPGQQDKTYEALLIRGSTTLPFDEEELNMIRAVVSEPDQRAARSFTASLAQTPEDIWRLLAKSKAQLLDDFRIVHFSGHYSGEQLLLGGKPLPITVLQEDMLSGSLLVLDGCSSGSNLDAWSDVEGLTASLINRGALGCVVTVLPVKHDPIVSKVLWGTFYGELRRGSSTVGQALAQARNKLRDHFAAIGSRNPCWAVYQLIGSPAVQLCDIEDEADG